VPCGTPFEHALDGWNSCHFCLLEEPTDGCAGDAMRLSDLAEALASSALLKNSNPVDIERPPADVPPLQPGARRIPARTRSMMRFRSSSAMAPMMITTARPSGPPVSRSRGS